MKYAWKKPSKHFFTWKILLYIYTTYTLIKCKQSADCKQTLFKCKQTADCKINFDEVNK